MDVNSQNKAILFRLQSLMQTAVTTYQSQLSPFLNPYEQRLANQLLTQFTELTPHWSGGFQNAQRRRLLVVPPYVAFESTDLQLQLFQINFNHKFIDLQHHQILGKLLNLGLDRNNFGDIITDGTNWQFVSEPNLTDLLVNEIHQIGKNTVALQPISWQKLLLIKNDYTMLTLNVHSMRLDQILSTGFKLSRQKAKELVQRGLVSINWQHEKRSDYLLTIGDTISVRGKGRLSIVDLLGQNKDYWQLYVQLYQH